MFLTVPLPLCSLCHFSVSAATMCDGDACLSARLHPADAEGVCHDNSGLLLLRLLLEEMLVNEGPLTPQDDSDSGKKIERIINYHRYSRLRK